MTEINRTRSQRNRSHVAILAPIRRSGKGSTGNAVNALEHSSMEPRYVIVVARGVTLLESGTRMFHQVSLNGLKYS